MDWTKSHRLFGGEVVVKPSGIYTFAHFYRNSRQLRSVILVGTNHVGDAEYYQRINDILAGCDLVLFEDSGGAQAPGEFEEFARSMLYGSDLESAFQVAMQIYFLVAQRVLALPTEGGSFDYQQPGWISGEREFLTEEQQTALMEEFEARMRRIPVGRVKQVVEFARRSVEKMDQGGYTGQDLGDGFVFFWSDAQLVGAVSDTIGKPRDRNCLEFFDEVVREREPKMVGIKFGAGHTAFQRQLLEERGYVREVSTELCNIRYR
ncbi:hypothetical protein A2V54_00300 [candidate division WWE3 bacterium RBG_19FT_COMBO_53_11]|uniref:Uncharacterized protein n=1 Tax=candidate division WWE3 bacterium RBG_19FT_COMBO_53_11 TaxID=1802613 RepID=A0A1F4UHK8_UNCKA|nr:MAG: hypothetical protein A2155_00935 [candidate division WWE3 bacterium RBG_16_52_45]OGC44448.1 MAG: hypothetical protein A2V54_00300 [candidate division WWE3 bacterium RBG_19FT_COMBO_53_11]